MNAPPVTATPGSARTRVAGRKLATAAPAPLARPIGGSFVPERGDRRRSAGGTGAAITVGRVAATLRDERHDTIRATARPGRS